jgi:hypothetical protein
MLELVMVIVVLGILAATAIPRMERDLRQEAGDNILAAIRYTQHLALMDDKTNPEDPKWQMTLWQIRFSHYTKDGQLRWYYEIASNKDHGANLDQSEAAMDPSSGKFFFNRAPHTEIGPQDSESIFIGRKYGIDSIRFRGGCSGAQHIAFDHLGRPYTGIFSAGNDFSKLMVNDCSMTFGFEGGETPLVITVARETGFAQIMDQNGS